MPSFHWACAASVPSNEYSITPLPSFSGARSARTSMRTASTIPPATGNDGGAKWYVWPLLGCSMDQRFDFEPGMEMRMTELPQPRAASPDGSSSRDADIVSAGNVSAPVRNAGITRLETDNAEIPPIKPLLLVICPLMLKLAILHF